MLKLNRVKLVRVVSAILSGRGSECRDCSRVLSLSGFKLAARLRSSVALLLQRLLQLPNDASLAVELHSRRPVLGAQLLGNPVALHKLGVERLDERVLLANVLEQCVALLTHACNVRNHARDHCVHCRNGSG
ncbi:hypothetical protein CAOG_009366 [Capsaspora owczarzaki ATCC 30864]|uniref:Uncharacterized protein n=1 Tax=Capsaspora owczarzaki (strain ATCC 30864) TaxID=595528 RepID=A0A0D2WI52_CAPO3|nr:hypothetical protein CAOG_009366 [Capsaspora owczarzaki ATCC 30864]